MVVNAGSGIVARSRALDTEAFHIRQRLPVVKAWYLPTVLRSGPRCLVRSRWMKTT